MTSSSISNISKIKQKSSSKCKNNDILNIVIQRGGVILTCFKSFNFNLVIIKIISTILILSILLDILLKLKNGFNKN